MNIMSVEQKKLLDLTASQRKLFDSCKNNINIKSFTELYSDKFHFIYELLQNADDAQASEISFNLTREALEIRHDGKNLFNFNDVESITAVGFST